MTIGARPTRASLARISSAISASSPRSNPLPRRWEPHRHRSLWPGCSRKATTLLRFPAPNVSPESKKTRLRTILHHERVRHGDGAVHFSLDRWGAWRPNLGNDERGWRDNLQFCASAGVGDAHVGHAAIRFRRSGRSLSDVFPPAPCGSLPGAADRQTAFRSSDHVR
jgi:hypothetical protein